MSNNLLTKQHQSTAWAHSTSASYITNTNYIGLKSKGCFSNWYAQNTNNTNNANKFTFKDFL